MKSRISWRTIGPAPRSYFSRAIWVNSDFSADGRSTGIREMVLSGLVIKTTIHTMDTECPVSSNIFISTLVLAFCKVYAYSCPMTVQTLIAALAEECKTAREELGASHGDVFASFDRESRPQTIKTVERFEDGLTWPRNPQATVDAYANLSGVPSWELWQQAIDRWRLASQGEDEDADPGRPPSRRPSPPRAPRSSPAKDRRQAGS